MRVDDEAARPDDDPRADGADPGALDAGRAADEGPSLSFAQTYRSPRPRRIAARNAVIAATTATVLAGAASAAEWLALRSAAGDAEGGRDTAVADLRREAGAAIADRVQDAERLVEAMTAVYGLVFLVAIVFVLRWQGEAVRQQWALGVDHPRFTARRAGWTWFVPVWFLFGPKQVYNDLWRASEPGAPTRVADASWRARRPGGLLAAWWATWLVGSFVGLPFVGPIETPTVGQAMDEELGALVGYVVMVVAGLLFLRVLDVLTDRLDRRAGELRDA